MELSSLIKPLSESHSTTKKLQPYVSTGYVFLKAHVEVATTSCLPSVYGAHAGMLHGAVGMQMILPTIFYVR